MNSNAMHKAVALALGSSIFASPSYAEMTCSALGTYLASQPNVSQYVPPPSQANPNPAALPFTQLLTTGGVTRCEANFIYSARGGPADGYAVGQNQRIGIRVGFPLNSADTNGGPSAWNGKVRNIGGGGLQGGLSAVTSATNTGYVGSNTDTGHPTQDNPNFPVIQATHELNYGRLDDFLVESIHQQYKWALALTEVYYSKPATRNYWDGCSTGGREGLSMALNFG
ncbi:MAG TPA: tannase/feruloyl esterase family alpha/beta hydrolase, partial [Burkholderiales bacterium]|nr:tannase/feruloyl esterase family alpha/beta hydrolase [Burkholderiales bacterium]